jgi:hypothetical protein
MSSTTAIRPRARTAAALGIASLAAALAAPYGVVAAHVAQGRGATSSLAVGELARGALGPLAAAGIVLLGVGCVLGAAGIRRALPPTAGARGGSALLVVAGVATVVWGIAPMDRGGDAQTFLGGVNAVAGAVASVAFALGALAASAALRGAPGWRAVGRGCRALSLAAAVLVVATWAVPGDAFGAVERAWLLAADAWLLAVAFRLSAPPSEAELAPPAPRARHREPVPATGQRAELPAAEPATV